MRLHIRESVASLAVSHAKPALSACLALSLLVAGGCGDLTGLKQENPGQIDAGSLYIPANAQLLVTGAIAEVRSHTDVSVLDHICLCLVLCTVCVGKQL